MNPRKRLGELLVESGVIDEFQLKAALGHQRQWGGKIGQTLVDLKLVTEPAVVSALARRLECEVARLDELRPSRALDEAIALVPADLARKHLAVPLEATRTTLTVAMADPANVAAVDELGFHAGRRVKALLAGPREIARAVARFYGDGPAGALSVDFDRTFDAADEDPAVFEQSPAKFQERFYRTSMRDPSLPLSPLHAVPPEAAAPAPPPPPSREAEVVPAPPPVALREAVTRLAAGAEVPSVSPAAVVAGLTAVLVRRGLVTEAELVSELWRQRGGGQRA